MTVQRHPGSIEAALLRALAKLSPDVIKAVTGVTDNHLYKCSNPDMPQRLHAHHASAIDLALIAQDDAPLMIPCLAAMVGAGPVQEVDLDASLRHAAQELGELSGVVDRALADGVVDRRERYDIAEQARQLAEVAQRIQHALTAPPGPPKAVA